MKKIIKITLLLLILLGLTSCKDNKKEYQVIEISSNDLKKAIDDNKTNFVFAILNRKYENSNLFLEDLQKVAERGKTNIYYIDYDHVSVEASTTIVYDIGYNSDSGHFFGVYENGMINTYGYYKDFNDTLSKLHEAKYTKPIEITTEEQQEEYIAKAEELYSEYKYNSAMEYINKAWPNKKAQEFYNNSPYLQISHIWESYEFIDKKYEKMNYKIFYFLKNNDEYCMYYEKKNATFDGFKKPEYKDLTYRYFNIKDDIIYMSNKEDGSYEKYYKIISIDESILKLEDLKRNKVLTFQRRE